MLSGQRRERRNKRRKIFAIILIIGTLLILIAYGIVDQSFLRKNYMITTGLITDCRYPMNRGALSFYFDYEVDGKKYQYSTIISNLNTSYARDFIGKQFPVAYSKNDPEKCRILITRYDFNEFSIPFPDSLNWVRRYEN